MRTRKEKKMLRETRVLSDRRRSISRVRSGIFSSRGLRDAAISVPSSER
jgi:hypothetical protein